MREIVSPLDGFRGLTSRRGVSLAALIRALFRSGEAGVLYDPNDISTLFKDVAGTDPVTTPGQTVARINDKSGNGYHATQATAAARPQYQVIDGKGYLSFDGVDDAMSIPSAAFVYGPADVWAAYRYTGGSSFGPIIRNNGTGGGQNRFQLAHTGVDFGATGLDRTGAATDADAVIGGFVNATSTATQGFFRSNNGTGTGAVTRAGMATTFSLFAVPSFGDYTAGRFYGGLAIMRNLTEAERTNVKAYLASKTTGVSL